MGCDIHPHIEFKFPDRTYYEHFASPNMGQDYLLFAILAGVRHDWVQENDNIDVSPPFPPRGVAQDLSHPALRGHDGWEFWSPVTEQWHCNDYHTPSWLNTDEFRKVLSMYFHLLDTSEHDPEQQCHPLFGAELRAVLAAMEALPNARLVFWFDN